MVWMKNTSSSHLSSPDDNEGGELVSEGESYKVWYGRIIPAVSTSPHQMRDEGGEGVSEGEKYLVWFG